MKRHLTIDQTRLERRLEDLARIGSINGKGSCRVALTSEDKQGRDLVVSWMKELGMTVQIDQIGNIIAVRPGREDLAPVMTGSHVDTVTTGGRLDGSYGVVAGLEVINVLEEHDVQTRHPLGVVVFTNEEGVRYAPDMMGSLVYAGRLPVREALATKGSDGSILGEELKRIQYAGKMACGEIKPHAFIELHIEQGPILEREGIMIGAVQDLVGISWQEITIAGQSNHAGTTPTALRHDAGLVAARIISFVRDLALSMGGNQRATCGSIRFRPDQINVIPGEAIVTVDLRNSDERLLRQAEQRLAAFVKRTAREEGVTFKSHRLVRFQPVQFSQIIVETIERTAIELGYSVRRMTSGAGQDAQMMARICPAAMTFVPSKDGISHNPAEYTRPSELVAGANVLLHTLLELAK